MIRRSFKILLLLTSGWLLAGPLALLQFGAWGWMLVSYSSHDTFQQAFIETFSDDRPCDLCRIIDTLEAEESDFPPIQIGQEEIKLMLGLARAIIISAPNATPPQWSIKLCEPDDALVVVPTPPPRAV